MKSATLITTRESTTSCEIERLSGETSSQYLGNLGPDRVQVRASRKTQASNPIPVMTNNIGQGEFDSGSDGLDTC